MISTYYVDRHVPWWCETHFLCTNQWYNLRMEDNLQNTFLMKDFVAITFHSLLSVFFNWIYFWMSWIGATCTFECLELELLLNVLNWKYFWMSWIGSTFECLELELLLNVLNWKYFWMSWIGATFECRES